MLDTTQGNNTMTDDNPNPRRVKARKTVPISQYDEVLNLVRNTLKVDEREALERAGYSGLVSAPWRADGNAPLVAVNALLGLLVGLEIQRNEDRQPLRLSVEELLAITGDLRPCPLQAKLYREVARRIEEKDK